nr:hypothetical protein B0A51_14696 [Rachicladosporium sp. CCFEE 5018]
MAAPSTSTKIGHSLAKVLGIKLEYRDETGAGKLTRGESTFTIDSADSYVENEPTAAEWLRSVTPTGKDVTHYLYHLFPFTHWILNYNVQWLIGDLIAGITIGAVVVPQGMAYAQLAQLPVEYGLYSSFMGVLIYWFFATSKDITIGPVAVMSTIVGNIVLSAQAKDPSVPGHVIASALSVLVGSIVTGLGLLRFGWLVDFISLTSISAFMTGSAINIAVGQTVNLMGITGVNSRDSTYLVVVHVLKHLGRTHKDAALGLTALFMLYGIRFMFNTLAKRMPQHRKLFFFLNTLRTVFVILLYTLISWATVRHIGNNSHSAKTATAVNKAYWKVLGPVPRGFQHAGAPVLNSNIIGLFTSEIPASVIVLLIEHISIAKSFGRVNNYTIDPSQEMIAIGVTNILGPFLGGYPATGSFSRTAIKAKAGVRTPFAGVITAVIVLLALYALPVVFFYIPQAALSAVIIHAVGDLITPPNAVYQFWKISPLEVIIFFAGVIVTVFTSIEIGIYVTVASSFAVFVFRTFKAKGRFLGRVQIHSVVGDLPQNETKNSNQPRPNNDPDKSTRNVWIPIDHEDGTNPGLDIEHPYPGVFIYRFSEGFNYPNANHYTDHLINVIFKATRRTNANSYGRLGDRPWNDPGPRRGKPAIVDSHKPTLKAIILDFSSINNIDVTSVQNLIDVRNQLDRYTSPETVQWHFACINNRWTKRGLVSGGFGYPTPAGDGEFHSWKPIFSVASMGGDSSAAHLAEQEFNRRRSQPDVEAGRQQPHEIQVQHGDLTGETSSSDRGSFQAELNKSNTYTKGKYKADLKPVQGLNRPFFHIDLTSALQSVLQNIQEEQPAQRPEAKVVEEEDAKGEKYA